MKVCLRLALIASILAPPLVAREASAKVLITEVQVNSPDQTDVGEWIELQNTSTVAVSIAGWTLNDYTQMAPDGEQPTRWTFPALASIGAGQVILVTRQAAQFFTNTNIRATWELADGNDDAMVPNLTAVGGTTPIRLTNDASGDAVVLRNEMGTIMNAVEWGTVDRTVPGTPFTSVPGAGASLIRVNDLGSSNTDFVVTTSPSPGVGFGGAVGPLISATRARPQHVRYGDTLVVTSNVTDTEALSEVSINLATATSSAGATAQDYAAITMTSTAVPPNSLYSFSGAVGTFNPGLAFPEPTSFHERFIRYYVSASDAALSATDPAMADEASTNTHFRQRNVMPTTPSPIRDVREETATGAARWPGLSVTVRGVALSTPGILTPNRLDLAIVDDSGFGIRVFNNEATTLDITEGDLVEATGSISQFRGVMQVAGQNTLTKLGGKGTVSTATVTIADLLARGEDFESRLVLIQNVGFADATTMWPGNGTGGNVTIKDDTGTMSLRVTAATDLFGTAAPQYGFDVRGIVGQFTQNNDGTMGGYQIVPRGSGDIFAKAAPPTPDAGVSPDSGSATPDAGSMGGRDAGTSVDSGSGGGGGGGAAEDSGCNCSTSGRTEGGLTLGVLALLGLAVLARRRR